MNLIVISGKKQSGKDTVGKIIQYLTSNHNLREINELILSNKTNIYPHKSKWEIKKFADKLKDIICILISCSREDLEDEEFKNTELGKEWWVWKFNFENSILEDKINDYTCGYLDAKNRNIYHQPEDYKLIKYTPRLLLQNIGTGLFRNQLHPDIWCTSLFNQYYGDVEIWKDIENYENSYQISNLGRVRGKDRVIRYSDKKGAYHTKKSSILKPTISGKYQTVKLSNKTFTIHSLVANAFLADKNEVINHIDQNPLNNFVKNLEWTTQSENIKQANLYGNGNMGEKQADAKLTEHDVLEIKQLLKNKTHKQNVIATIYNVSSTTISDIKYGRKWKNIGVDIPIIKPILPKATPNWIITDMRFKNELTAVKERNGITIRVNRPMENSSNHISETELDNVELDYTIDNSGSIQDLIVKVEEILIKENII